MRTWTCYREESTGRWAADRDGLTWCNAARDAHEFDVYEHGPAWSFFVMDDAPNAFAADGLPDVDDWSVQRIYARAWVWCSNSIDSRRKRR